MGFELQPQNLEMEEAPLYGKYLNNLKRIIVGAGANIFYVDPEGARWGDARFDQANAFIKNDGSYKFKDGSGNVLIDSAGTGGNYINLINSNLNTQTKLILGEFQFQGSGALKIATDDNNGVWISPTGILGKKAGATTFAIDNGGNATFGGTLVAASGTFGMITAGTFTGVTIQTATSGRRMKIDGSNNKLQWLNNDSVEGYIYNDGSGNMVIDADNAIYITADGAGDDIAIHAGDVLALYANNSIQMWFNKDGGSDTLGFVSGAGATVVGTLNGSGDLAVSGDVQCGGTFKSSDGSSGGNYTSYGFVTNARLNGGVVEKKYREITVKDGLITNISAESGWL
jgi:hypothetical protein